MEIKMLFERKDISRQLESFTNSSSFKDFEDIINDIAIQKFMEIQSNPDTTSHAKMIADRIILNFYMNLTRDMKFRLEQLILTKAAENAAKIAESQRVDE
jgi:hypothetical protein